MLAKRSVDTPGIISAAVYRGCIDLPQELIDCIMDMLHDDLPTLKACSLTCRSMFASTRHLIHRTLYLKLKNALGVSPLHEGSTDRSLPLNEELLRYLSFMDEHDLLQFVRRVYILVPDVFVPEMLQPYRQHLQSLNRVQILTIEHLDTSARTFTCYKTCFVHFYPTLTSLALRSPSHHYRLLVKFILQFPNLENLSLERIAMPGVPDSTDPIIVDQPPPFCGHLRLVDRETVAPWLMTFVREVPSGMNFRSVDLRASFWEDSQHILDPCSCTLEYLTLGPHPPDGTCPLSSLQLIWWIIG